MRVIRVARGGSWDFMQYLLRPSCHYGLEPSWKYINTGFRIVVARKKR